MRRLLSLALGAWTLAAQPPAAEPLPAIERQRAAAERQRARASGGAEQGESAQARARARQQAAAERQRALSVRQAGAAGGEEFFALPWPEPPRLFAGCGRLEGGALAAVIEQGARANGLAPELLRAVARRESGFDPCAVSPAGAMGLMQLMPATAQALGVADPFDPAQSVEAGGRYLRQLLERYGGDLRLALGAYNAGPGRVDREGGVPRIAETEQYVRRVLGDLGAGAP